MLFPRRPGRVLTKTLALGALGLLVIWATNRPEPLNPIDIPPLAKPATRSTAWTLSLTPTPRRWDGDGFREAFAVAEKLVPTICLPDPVDWWHARGDSPEDSKPFKDSRWQRFLLDQHRLQAFIQMDPYKSRRGKIPDLPRRVRANSFADPVLRSAFIADAKQRVEAYRPKYLCLAMEINAYYEQHPEDFDHFVSLFREARKAVKQIDPAIVVFVSFQYEQFLGLFGGQTGLPKHGPHWELLERFGDEVDAVGISSYPFEKLTPPRFRPPAELPDDYYRRIAEHTDKPVIFAELGWSSDPAYGGSPGAQAAFLDRLPELLKGLDVPLINYNFLFDAKGFGEAFDSMGLIDAKGKLKPALEAFRGL